MSGDKLWLRALIYNVAPFMPYLIGFYLIAIQGEIGGGLAISFVWSIVDIALTCAGKDLYIIWEEIDNN